MISEDLTRRQRLPSATRFPPILLVGVTLGERDRNARLRVLAR